MIEYPVDPSTRWTVYHEPTGLHVHKNIKWPDTDGNPITLDPGYVMLRHVDGQVPPHDRRLYVMTRSEPVVDVEANTVSTNWTPSPRPIEERKQAAENVEAERFGNHFDFDKFQLHTAIMVGLMYHFAIDGQSIPSRFRAFANNYRDKVKDKLLPNRDRLLELIQGIEDGDDVDLDLWPDNEPAP